jgi:hypothetical protein
MIATMTRENPLLAARDVGGEILGKTKKRGLVRRGGACCHYTARRAQAGLFSIQARRPLRNIKPFVMSVFGRDRRPDRNGNEVLLGPGDGKSRESAQCSARDFIRQRVPLAGQILSGDSRQRYSQRRVSPRYARRGGD